MVDLKLVKKNDIVVSKNGFRWQLASRKTRSWSAFVRLVPADGIFGYRCISDRYDSRGRCLEAIQVDPDNGEVKYCELSPSYTTEELTRSERKKMLHMYLKKHYAALELVLVIKNTAKAVEECEKQTARKIT